MQKYQTTALELLVSAKCGPSGMTKSSFSDVKQALCVRHSCSPSCLLCETDHMTMLLNGKWSLPPRPSGSVSINNKRRQTLSAGRRRYTQPDEWPTESHFTNKKGALLCRLRHFTLSTKQWCSRSVPFNLESVFHVQGTCRKPICFGGHTLQS